MVIKSQEIRQAEIYKVLGGAEFSKVGGQQ